MIEIRFDVSLESFLKEAGPLLYQNEAENALMLGLCESFLKEPNFRPSSPLLWRILLDGKTVSAAIQTPPNNLIVSRAKDEEIRGLAQYLFEKNLQFPGVVGPSLAAEMFSEAWRELNACRSAVGMRQKIYKLEELQSGVRARGGSRIAGIADAELLARWLFDFSREALNEKEWSTTEQSLRTMKKIIERRGTHIWEIDGQSVSMTCTGRPTKNGISIYGVFTPKNLRKSGFASSLVADVSQAVLDSGKKFCVLYTDLANPTSNKIYQDIGYREVAGSQHFIFGAEVE